MNKIYTLFFILFSLVLYSTIISYSAGPATSRNRGYTGAPGEGGTRCGNCHNGSVYGTVTADIAVYDAGTNTPVTFYSPGGSYDVEITINYTAGTPPGFGFQSLILDEDDNSVDTLRAVSANTKTKKTTYLGGRVYAEQNKVGGVNSASNVFRYNWIAPLSKMALGDYTIYAVGNAVNNNGGSGGTDGGTTTTATMALPIDPDLPVELTDFTAENRNNQILLEWKTAAEINSDKFLVQRSLNGIDYQAIGVQLAAGESRTERNYRFLDENPMMGSYNYYRLKQVDLDGEYAFSEVLSMKLESKGRQLEIFPQPTIGAATVIFPANNAGKYQMTVRDMAGRSMQQNEMNMSADQATLKIDLTDLPSGMYILEMTSRERQFSEKLIKM